MICPAEYTRPAAATTAASRCRAAPSRHRRAPFVGPNRVGRLPQGRGWLHRRVTLVRQRTKRRRAEQLNLWITETLAELPDGGLILVGHGLVMATLITRLLGLPFSGAPCMATHANTGVSNLRYVRDKGAFLLESLNDTRHVSADAREKGLLTGCDAYRDGWAAALPTPSWDLHRFSPLVGRGVLFPRLPPELRQQTLAMRADGLWANEEG